MISSTMAGYQANQQHSTTSSSSHSTNHEPRPSHSKPPIPPPSTHDREALPPPPQRDPKPNQRDNPPPFVSFPTPADFRRSSSSTAALAGSQVLSHAKDDDETDDDDDVPSRGNTDSGSVEDVCLGCEGQCRCGGAKGATVYVAADRARGLKVRITLSSATASAPVPVASTSAARASASTSSAIASTSTLPHSYPHQRSRHVSFSESSSDEYAPHRQQKKQKLSTGSRNPKAAPVASGSGVVAGAPVAPPRKRGRPRKYPHPDDAPFSAAAPPRKGATSTSPQARRKTARPLPQPSRMSLRQVLAASVKDADVPVLTMESPPREKLSDVSDLELEDSEGEDEGRIERAEEKALREEFEKGDEGSSSAEGDDDLTDWEEMELAARKQAKREGSVVAIEEDDGTIADIPASGGRGVVTWSDYDSINEEDDDEEDQEEGGRQHDEDDEDDDVAGEFEDELEELLAISEAVVGPVRDDEYELGQMWFEEIANLGDDETDSADEDSEDEEEEEEGQTLVIVDAWGGATFRHVDESGSSGDDESDFDDQMNYDSEDGGDTTDSLDSDDHVGLVRFGIEVDTDSSSSSDSDGGEFYRFAPGTASLADVQAPTSADLASLPQYLFTGADSLGMTINLQGLDDDPDRAIREAAEGYGFGAMDNVVEGQFSAAAKGKGKARIQDIREEDEAGTESDGVGGMKSPAMGCFGPADSGRAAELTVVIDGSDNVAPSPFSKLKKGKKRGRQQLLDGTPSRRVRADSKVSTASGRSITDGSLSGEVADLASPYLASTAMDLELADVLNDSILHEPSSGSPSSEDSDAEVADGLRSASATGLSDLSRWNRIPIGAFRSSTMPSSQQTAQYFAATAEEAAAGYNGRRSSAGGTLYLPVPGAVLRGTRVGSSLSHTLSSPHTTSSTTKRAIERRMLTSPVFGPAIFNATSSPKSRKVKRKEKKAQSSTSARVPSPKQAFTSGTSFGTPQIA